ncbi:MAG TPA: DUF4440 domain-containing protein [Acidobacteriaceae bacterium]|jgi:hypothetical protein|nr:DUF4440 domain-containing protein [Acidobacteriaceae bacterium]
MESGLIFTNTDQKLLAVLQELRRREPIFHSAEFGTSTADYERNMAPDYWEVGASGKRYSREFILREFEGKPAAYAEILGWKSWGYAVRQLGPDTYLLTYTLRQGERLTRRATIWRRAVHGWSILYHQGTIVSVDEDDDAPSTKERLLPGVGEQQSS